MGGSVSPAELCHDTESDGGDGAVANASTPDRQATYTVVPDTASPPSASLPQADTEVSCPPMPPRCAWLRRYAVCDFPTCTTVPLDSSAGAVEPRSASPALSLYQAVGAKYWSSPSDGLSSKTESLKSYGSEDEVFDPLPAAAQMLPEASTSGAAPPIHRAPSRSPAPASTS